MKNLIQKLNKQENLLWFARFSIFFIYFYFGLLKLLNLSPATDLVIELHKSTIPFIPFNLFYTFFSAFEIVLGIMFLIPKLKKLTLILFLLHNLVIFSALILLPQFIWSGFLVATLEGQYILKNIVMVAFALLIYRETKSK